MIDEAAGKIESAYALSPAASVYNLACIAALRGDEITAQSNLEEAHRLGSLPDKAHLLADQDAAAMREKEWFEEFLRPVFGQ